MGGPGFTMLNGGEPASRLTDVVLLRREDVFQNTHSRIPSQSQESQESLLGQTAPALREQAAGCGRGSACGGDSFLL